MKSTLTAACAIPILVAISGCASPVTPNEIKQALPFDGTNVLLKVDRGQVRELSIMGEFITGKTINTLARIESLRTLKMEFCTFTDDAWQSLKQLRQIRALDIDGSKIEGRGLVGDEDLVFVKELPGLTGLSLARTSLSDRSVGTLQHLKALKSLDVSFTQITEYGVEKLRQSLVETLIVNAK